MHARCSLASFFVYDKMATNQAIVADRTSGISAFGYFSAAVSDWIE